MEKKSAKKWVMVGLVLLVVLGGYLFGVMHFSKNTYPRTTVNGEARGGESVERFAMMAPTEEVVTFTGRDGAQVALSEADLGIHYDVTGAIPEQPSAWRWPVEVFGEHAYTVDYTRSVDEKALEKRLIEGGFDPNGAKPEDAKLVIEETGARVEPEKRGASFDMAELKSLVLEALRGSEREVSVEALYENPKVLKDDATLTAEADQINQYLKATVSFPMGSKTYTFGPKEMIALLEPTDDGYALNPQGLRDWVRDMAIETDTYGTTRTFETTGEGTVEVPPGIYGWRIDVDETVNVLKELLQKGGSQEAEAVYLNEGMARGEQNDIGDTYIEIDLSRQHLWAYKDGELIYDAAIKTGKVNDYNETPRGVNMIWSREEDRTLNGHYKDGTPYNSPVKYWMPVNYGGVGMHDASWVERFGGTEYIHNGSNGCINLNLKTAKFIYDNYRNGTPVVIYESSTNYSPAEDTF